MMYMIPFPFPGQTRKFPPSGPVHAGAFMLFFFLAAILTDGRR